MVHARTRRVSFGLGMLAVALSGFIASGLSAAPLDAVQTIFKTSFEDGEVCTTGCPPDGWQFLQWPMPVNYATCSTVFVYGIVAGNSYLFTTCVPPGAAVGTGDPVIQSIFSNNGIDYQITNDDCTDSQSIPQLVGWDCANSLGQIRMACAPANRNGVTAQAGTTRLDVQVCPFTPGSSPLYIWWKGSGSPNPG